jgi:virulence-associated protein VagC
MLTISTVLTTSGTSKAVRIPSLALKQSKLGKELELLVSEGEIIIRNRDSSERWSSIINKMVEDFGDPSDEFSDMRNNEIKDLEWNGISYKDWKKSKENNKLIK